MQRRDIPCGLGAEFRCCLETVSVEILNVWTGAREGALKTVVSGPAPLGRVVLGAAVVLLMEPEGEVRDGSRGSRGRTG